MLPYRDCSLPKSRNWNAYCASYPRLKYAIITGTECQMCLRSETEVCHTQRIRMHTVLLFVTEICHDHGNGIRKRNASSASYPRMKSAIITETECLNCNLSETEVAIHKESECPLCFISKTEVSQNHGNRMLNVLLIRD